MYYLPLGKETELLADFKGIYQATCFVGVGLASNQVFEDVPRFLMSTIGFGLAAYVAGEGIIGKLESRLQKLTYDHVSPHNFEKQ